MVAVRARLPVTQFEAFLKAAKPLLLRDLPRRLAAVLPRLERVRRWLLPPDHDLFHLARLTYGEDAYTNLMAWCLRPAMHPGSAVHRQRAWLCSLTIPEAEGLDSAAEPARTQSERSPGRRRACLGSSSTAARPSWCWVSKSIVTCRGHPI